MSALAAREVFGLGGLLSRAYPGFELRSGQIKMSEAVAEAIEHSRHLLMEAPTGTGKTFAYLVPAVDSGQKVVVSTGTKNLQEQLILKDIPQLARALGRPIRAVCMKGRDNYLCIKRHREYSESPLFEQLEEEGHYRSVLPWSRTTQTGDRGELATLPDNLRLWDRINARADTCLGQKCPDFEPCYLTRMRREAKDAQVIVVNHHLLLADLVLRGHAFGQVIPDYNVLILDEAHSLEEIATAYLGRSISWRQVNELADDLARLAAGPEARLRADGLRGSAKAFFDLLGPTEPETREAQRFPLDPYRLDDLWRLSAATLREALSLCEMAARKAVDRAGGEAEAETLAARASDQAATLDLILKPKEEGPPAPGPIVTWGERRGRGLRLHASPIDVSEPLRRMLFSRVPAVILTSATLAIDGSFAFVRGRLGLDEASELILESPFDLARQAVLFVPKRFPEPRDESFPAQFVEVARSLLDVTAGRAFLLFTSFANLRRVHQSLRGSVPYPLLAQGDAPRHVLLERFRSTPGAVLLATSSFWHGVDVQGDALSLVVIDKLPFDVPSDPIVSARIEAIRSAGGAPFAKYQLPAAVIDLKQGLGRLIRSRQDRGLLAVMDVRLRTRPYGRVFINSLPPFPVIHEIEAARAFFDRTA